MKALLPAIFVLQALTVWSQSELNVETEARLLAKVLVEKHVQPRAIDDAFSAWTFDHLIDQLDPEKLYITTEDLNTINAFRTKIDDDLNGTSWIFLPELAKLYKTCIDRYVSGIQEISKKAVDFNRNVSLSKDTIRALNVASLRTRWEFEFRFRLLNRLYDLKKRSKVSATKDFLAQSEKSAAAQVEKVMLHEAEKFRSGPSGLKTHVSAELLSTIASAFDPHTTYFSPQQVKDFMSSLSSKGYYYGFTLGENEVGEVSIVQLMPGGPAWNSGQVEIGDIIQAMKFEGQPILDLWGFDAHDVNGIMESSMETSMALTLRKADGSVVAIPLQKEKVDSDEDVVKSFLLTGQKKIGFISLPDFYSKWGDEDGTHCANDVAREIVKMKLEKIDGLIIDLRFNGGGVLAEAVAMAGIFIDAGPILVLKNKAGSLTTVKDINRGTIYEGPLVVLVNEMSASASELLAAALQDYHRAVIVGGTTYGKGTAQQIVPTNPQAVRTPTKFSANTSNDDAGFASITMEKFYRVTGKSNQFIGVVPDVNLPGLFHSLPIGEKYMPMAFPPDSIRKRIYYQALPLLPVTDLQAKSKKRIMDAPGFAKMPLNSERLTTLYKTDEPVSLRWDDFSKQRSETDEFISSLRSNTNAETQSFKAYRLETGGQPVTTDSYINDYNNRWVASLQSDIVVDEAYHVACDLILNTVKK
ncbi:MAG: carboxy terminal-processing peptidase [Chryseolinea sp.]